MSGTEDPFAECTVRIRRSVRIEEVGGSHLAPLCPFQDIGVGDVVFYDVFRIKTVLHGLCDVLDDFVHVRFDGWRERIFPKIRPSLTCKVIQDTIVIGQFFRRQAVRLRPVYCIQCHFNERLRNRLTAIRICQQGYCVSIITQYRFMGERVFIFVPSISYKTGYDDGQKLHRSFVSGPRNGVVVCGCVYVDVDVGHVFSLNPLRLVGDGFRTCFVLFCTASDCTSHGGFFPFLREGG